MIEKIKEKIKAFLPEKWPSFCQCRNISGTLNEKEKSIFQIAITVFVTSLVVLSFLFYFQNTKIVPAFNGEYAEGMTGNPQFLNPVFSQLNDNDRDITNILFAKLGDHDSSGKLILDLAKNISVEGRTYKITLKENLYWSDGEEINADDLIFTIEAIQNQKTRSPLRPSWMGVEVEKVSDLEVSFKLEEESSIFLNRLSLQLIPKHIWEKVDFERFAFSHYNLEPVVSGPYRIKEKTQNSEKEIEKITLELNPYYHGKKPYLEKISFVFFDNIESLINASKRNEIDGFSAINPKIYDNIIKETGFNEYNFKIPRYFGLFFNPEEREILNDKEFREALNYGTNKQEIIEKVLFMRGEETNSPALPEVYNFDFSESHNFDFNKSNEILDNLGLKKNENGFREKLIRESRSFEFKNDLKSGSQGDEVRHLQKCLKENNFYDEEITGFFGTETRDAVNSFQEKYKDEILVPGGFAKGTGMVSENTRKKLNELCQETPRVIEEVDFIITTVDQELMKETAEEIKRQWEKLGIKININLLDIRDLEDNIIKPRNYEILLFGKALEPVPDFFHFWHSSQKGEYGFNLSMYENEKADTLLSETRRELNAKEREKKIKELSDIIIEDVPAVFLFNLDYVFYASNRIKGIQERTIFNPSQKFHNIESWYTQTRRTRK